MNDVTYEELWRGDKLEPVMTDRPIEGIHTTATPAVHLVERPCNPRLRPIFREIALRNGFKDKLQDDFTHDLHHYVYKTLQEVFELGADNMIINPITMILQWHKDACPKPTVSDIFTGTACMYEEVSEYASSVGANDLSKRALIVAEVNYDTAQKLNQYDDHDEFVQVALSHLDHVNKKAHLDALCDIIVVALQDGYRSGYDMEGALAEVIRSNESKRMPDGSFPRNEAGKIIKTSPLYSKADVTPFIGE